MDPWTLIAWIIAGVLAVFCSPIIAVGILFAVTLAIIPIGLVLFVLAYPFVWMWSALKSMWDRRKLASIKEWYVDGSSADLKDLPAVPKPGRIIEKTPGGKPNAN